MHEGQHRHEIHFQLEMRKLPKGREQSHKTAVGVNPPPGIISQEDKEMKTDTMFKSDEIEQIENAMKECLDNVAKYHYEGNQEVADFFKNEYFRLADKHHTEMKNWLAIW